MIGRNGKGDVIFASNLSGDKARRILGGVGYPLSSRPQLMMKHIDGPLLTFRDGQMHWLTLRERWRVWRGKEDALSPERKLRPDLSS